MKDVHIRQFDILQPSPLNITIIGAGGIGSWTALSLAKIGYEHLTVYDFDDVEIHNVATQFYKLSDVGKPKVEALKENIKDFSGVEITAVNEKAEKINADILILAVDNMKSRAELVKNSTAGFFIDARMGGQIFNIYSFLPFEKSKYDSTLFDDEHADPEPCTSKAIAYNVFGIASYISNIVKRFDKNEKFPFELNGDYVNLKLYNTKF